MATTTHSSITAQALLAIPTPERYLPLMNTLSVKGTKDAVSFFNEKAVGGSYHNIGKIGIVKIKSR
jgi:hypothetical protein